MQPAVNYRKFDYNRTYLPNRFLAEQEKNVKNLDEAIATTGLSIGYPGWNLLYYLLLCHLHPGKHNNIIETGTNVGASTIILAQALADAACPGHVYTVEQDYKNFQRAQHNLALAQLNHLVTAYCGNSHEVLVKLVKQLQAPIRAAFLDASHLTDDVLKEFEIIYPHLESDAIVIFDNTYQIAEPYEDQRVHGALHTICRVYGGNLVNFPYVSWFTPGIAVWQQAAWPTLNPRQKLFSIPSVVSATSSINASCCSSVLSAQNHRIAPVELIRTVQAVFPQISPTDIIAALHAAIWLQQNITGRCCGELGDRLAQFCVWVQIFHERQIHNPFLGIEIGTLFGGSCLMMLAAAQYLGIDLRLRNIDPLESYYDQKDDITGVPIHPQTLFENIVKAGFSLKSIDLKRCRSSDNAACDGLTPASCAVLLIDGDHSTTGVQHDWEKFHTFITPGGFVLFDDYCNHHWPEVAIAVDKIVAKIRNSWRRLGCLGSTLILQYQPFTTKRQSAITIVNEIITEEINFLLDNFYFTEQAKRQQISIRQMQLKLACQDSKSAHLLAQWALATAKCAWLRLGNMPKIKHILLFGAGKHTIWLLDTMKDIRGPKIIGIVDDNAKPAMCLGKIPVFKPEEAPKDFDAIILSTDVHQAAFARRCREVWSEQVPLIDLYEGLPPGPYQKPRQAMRILL